MRRDSIEGPFGFGLSIDVEEWYHTCLVRSYVDPQHRPDLPRELHHLAPALLDRLAQAGCRATLFVLAETVDRDLGSWLRRAVAAGHEIASHGTLHFRADWRSVAEFKRDAVAAKARLEDASGVAVNGFRAPEWSLRRADNPRLEALAEAGYRYDASLVASPGVGALGNPRRPSRLCWAGDHARAPHRDEEGHPDGPTLLAVPPLLLSQRLRVPGFGWCARLAGNQQLVRAARRTVAAGGLPVLNAHPWEIADRPTPGPLPWRARLIHDVGRRRFARRFDELLAACAWQPIREALGRTFQHAEEPERVARVGLKERATIRRHDD